MSMMTSVSVLHAPRPPLWRAGDAYWILDVVAHGEQCEDEADERGLERDKHAVTDTRLQHRVEP